MSCNSVTVHEVEKTLQLDKVLVIDMRDALSFRCGHLKNAINVQLSRLHLILNNLQKTISVLLYCEFGDESAQAADLFAEMGFDQCVSIDGGYEAMMKEQHAEPSASLCNWLQEHGYSCDDLEKSGFNGETALMFAARNGKTEFVVDLIDRGALIEARNNDGNSALWLACYSNDHHTLAELIRAGANLNVQNDNGATPLIYSASAGRYNMVKLLLEAGADISLKTLDDFTALEVSSTVEILKLLKKADAQRVKLAS